MRGVRSAPAENGGKTLFLLRQKSSRGATRGWAVCGAASSPLLIAGISMLLIATPNIVSGAVIISEIAWMGTATSANDEWIELHNNGSAAVDLSGWMLTDRDTLEIELAGTVGAGEFAVLERTDDSSAPGPAFLVYTGALANGGRTLSLMRPDDGVEDQVAGGTDWGNIGGNNETKETAQYTTGGWVTNTATPGAANKQQSSQQPESKDDTDEEDTADTSRTTSENDVDTTSGSGNDDAPSVPPDEAYLQLAVSGPVRAYVNQPLTFSVTPAGIADGIIDSVTFDWNFGDANTATGTETTHSYAYPGEYVVTVYGSYARHERVVRHRVTVLPATMSLLRTTDGAVQINNDARYEIDLSGYRLVAGAVLTLPPRTILLPRATLTVSPDVLESGPYDPIELFDQEDELVARYHPQQDAQPIGTVLGATAQVAAKPPSTAKAESAPNVAGNSTDTAFGFRSDAPPEITVTINPQAIEGASAVTSTNNTTSTTQPQPLTGTSPNIPSEAMPYLGLIGVLTFGLVGLYVGRTKST